MNMFQRIFPYLLLLAAMTSYAQEGCENRLIKREVPRWVNHSESIIEKYGECTVQVVYDLKVDGAVVIKGSDTKIPECARFKKSAQESVKMSKYMEGNYESCSTSITYQVSR